MRKQDCRQKEETFMPRGDESFQVLKKIGDNVYKVDLTCEYLVYNVFCVNYL